MDFRTLDQAGDIAGKTALVRVDFNVPMADSGLGKVGPAHPRVRPAMPTIRKLMGKGAKTVLLAHFDRPKGKRVPEMSLQPVVRPLAALIGKDVAFADDCVGPKARAAVAALQPGEVLLLENLRYHAGEEKNDPAFAHQLAELGDLYVNDAFSAAHRAHASTEGVARLLPAYAGDAMRAGLEGLHKALGHPKRPVAAIVAGSKVSTKLQLLDFLLKKVQVLVIGGAMANTLLLAQGKKVGRSLVEKNMLDAAQKILA